ncbi:SEC14-like protein 2 [Oculina patagonica]
MGDLDLTTEQQQILAQFRDCVSDVLQPDHDDHFLLRWLRARDFSIEKAEFMLRESLNVRRRLGLDSLVETYKVPEVLSKFYPGGYFGYDRDGSPVFIDPIGQIDFKGLLSSVKKEEIVRFKAYLGEYGMFLGRQQSAKLGKRIDQIVMVMDMEGLGLKHLWRPGVMVFNTVTSFYEDNFPEVMKNILVIKAPKIFPIAYALVKPFLSEVTRNKVKILGGDWKTELLEYIDEENLPEYYGGSCRDPDGDPLCRSKICYGGDVPAFYYGKENDKADSLKEESYQVGCVKRGTALKLNFEVDSPGSVLSWQYRSLDHDIGFGVFFIEKDKRSSKVLEEMIPTERRNCHMVPEEGSILCEKPGIYILRFDNSYSWTRNKKIFYNVEISTSTDNSVER